MSIAKAVTHTLKLYEDQFNVQVVDVWERSVRSTHHFLDPRDIDHYKRVVTRIDFHAFPVYCLMERDAVIGFIGICDQKIEMLFVDPRHIGQGHGKTLLLFALKDHGAERVDVNEQNTRAVEFYKGFGFETYDRLERDHEDKPYPILKMKLVPGTAAQ